MALSSRPKSRGRGVRASAEKGQAWEPLPAVVEPMAAMMTDRVPADPKRWAFEYKWDGVRAIVRWDGRNLNLYSRNLINITPNYPELAGLGEALGRGREVMLDGEVIAVDEGDRPSFARLQRRMHVRGPSARLVAEVPVYLVIFDLLHLDGRSLLRVPWEDRRAELEELTLAGASWRVSPAAVGQGEMMLETARREGLEGVMAKRVESLYEAGRRSANWLKIKVVQRQEFVVGGWAPQEGTTDVLGTLQVGYYDRPGGELVYAGSVGTGFNRATRGKLLELLGRLKTEKSPFAQRLPRRDVRFVVPGVVVEVEYRRWPAGGLVQQAAYKGVRRDKPAREVVKECVIQG